MARRRPDEEDQEALVDRAREGDADAFGQLVRLHQQAVFALALRLLGDPDLASDATQESFVRAWRSLPRFRRDSTFSTWLYRITANTSSSLRSRVRRRRELPLVVDSDRLADPGEDPEAAGENVELRAHLKAALAALPDAQRAVVVLKDVYQWTHAEVAEALGITVSSAKVRLHRARRRLRRELRRLRR